LELPVGKFDWDLFWLRGRGGDPERMLEVAPEVFDVFAANAQA
jgi:hypothetical protein